MIHESDAKITDLPAEISAVTAGQELPEWEQLTKTYSKQSPAAMLTKKKSIKILQKIEEANK